MILKYSMKFIIYFYSYIVDKETNFNTEDSIVFRELSVRIYRKY